MTRRTILALAMAATALAACSGGTTNEAANGVANAAASNVAAAPANAASAAFLVKFDLKIITISVS